MFCRALLVLLSISMDQRLQTCTDLYRGGEFSQAAEKLNALLTSGTLTEKEDILKAREYLGASYFILGEQDKARDEFQDLLIRDPALELSLGEFPPEIVNYFLEVKKEEEAARRERLKDLDLSSPPQSAPPDKGDQGRERTQAGAHVTAPAPVPIVKDRGSLALTLMPFGGGQLYRGEKTKGYLLMGGEAVLLAANLAALFQRSSLRNSDGTYSDPKRAKSLQSVQNISAIGLYAALAYGLGDALWRYVNNEPRRGQMSEDRGPRSTWMVYPPGGGIGAGFSVNF